MDNLNTHKIGSLYKRFPPAKANCLLDHLKIHYTPKHDSWLNIAEIDFNLFSKTTNSDAPRITGRINDWVSTVKPAMQLIGNLLKKMPRPNYSRFILTFSYLMKWIQCLIINKLVTLVQEVFIILYLF